MCLAPVEYSNQLPNNIVAFHFSLYSRHYWVMRMYTLSVIALVTWPSPQGIQSFAAKNFTSLGKRMFYI